MPDAMPIRTPSALSTGREVVLDSALNSVSGGLKVLLFTLGFLE